MTKCGINVTTYLSQAPKAESFFWPNLWVYEKNLSGYNFIWKPIRQMLNKHNILLAEIISFKKIELKRQNSMEIKVK